MVRADRDNQAQAMVAAEDAVMGRMAEKWEETRVERQEYDDFDWQAALMADPAFAEWLDAAEEKRE